MSKPPHPDPFPRTGDAQLVAPPRPPMPPQPSEPHADPLAFAFLGAMEPEEVEELVEMLNAAVNPPSVEVLLDTLKERLPSADRLAWAQVKEFSGSAAVARGLRRELDGSAAQERRRRELDKRMQAEAFERNRGLYREPDASARENQVAIEVLCAGNKGRCRKLRGLAYAIPHRSPGQPFLVLSNDGRRHSHPLFEGLVDTFDEGGTDVFHSFRCDHNHFVTDDPDSPGGNRKVSGEGVLMPHHLLEEPYKAFLRTGKVQTLRWAPGVSDTLYEQNPKRPRERRR